MIYELTRKPGELEEEVETYPTFYAVHGSSFLEAAARIVSAVARTEKGINVDDLTIREILGMVS